MATFTVQDIPAGLSGDQLTQALNLRLRLITAAVNATTGTTPQISSDLNIGGFHIINLGDPVAPTDALNLRSADKRYATLGSVKRQVSAASTAGGGVNVVQLTLTANTTIGTPLATVPGSMLVMMLLQDATGGRVVTWQNPPFRVSQANLGTLANTLSILLFTAIPDPADGILKWWLTAIPVTNAL